VRLSSSGLGVVMSGRRASTASLPSTTMTLAFGFLEVSARLQPCTNARNGHSVSTVVVESTINKILSKRMIKKKQMLWNCLTVPRHARRSSQDASRGLVQAALSRLQITRRQSRDARLGMRPPCNIACSCHWGRIHNSSRLPLVNLNALCIMRPGD
jgi:hypothetical protein